MHKNFVFWLTLGVVFVFGMLFQATINRRVASTDLNGSHAKILIDNDISSSNYRHLFVAVKSERESATGSDSITLNHIKGDLWGIKSPHATGESVGVAQFTVTVNETDSVMLKGQLDSKETIESIVSAVNAVAGLKGIDSQLVVGDNIMTPEWKSSIPTFLTTFLAHSGARQLIVEGDGLKLEGEVSAKAKAKLENLARLVSDSAVISNELTVLEKNIESVLIAKKYGGEIYLNGWLPNKEFRSKLVSLVGESSPDTPVNDQTKVGSNVTDPWWLESAENLVPMFLTAIDADGSIEYWPSHLLVSGTLASPEIQKKMETLAATFGKPEDYSVTNDLRIAPHDDPEIRVYRDDRGRLALEGQVSSTILKNQIVGGLLRHNPNVTIKDNLAVKDSVKALNLADPGKLVKDLMFDVKGGMLRITEDGIKIAGETNTTKLKERLLTHAAAVIGTHGKVESILTSAKSLVNGKAATTAPSSEKFSKDPGADEVNFKALAVYFNSGRSTVRDSQTSNLRLTARILRTKLPNTKVVVGGYADSKGNADFNRQLSMERANTVRDILISYGVPRDQMEVQYFGEDASNFRNSDMWRSRRVELTLFD